MELTFLVQYHLTISIFSLFKKSTAIHDINFEFYLLSGVIISLFEALLAGLSEASLKSFGIEGVTIGMKGWGHA